MPNEKEHIQDQTKLESGSYEIIRKRLLAQKDLLVSRLQSLSQARKEVFNTSQFILKANQRIDTENTCVARGIVSLNNLCIFGYNVHFGLRTEIKLEDVFSIYSFENNQFVPQSLELISDSSFITDYQNLYKYYRDSIFSKFRKTENYLYMIFQTSKNPDDLKAFKWLIKDDQLIYQDDRSIHEVKMPEQFEFQWIKTSLEDRRLGKYPHISILDKVFIEALHGDITFKIEDNTETGKGIYSEKVSNLDQQLDDAEYYYADLGNLIAIRIKPYQEDFRAYLFNVRTKEVVNLPSLNDSAILLPDNQGIIFSNGYYLQNGTHKIFNSQLDGVHFVRKIASPNGEDFLYIFTQPVTNTYLLMSYNIIHQMVETPIVCNGFTLFQDGSLIYFRTEPEATRHHQVQIWETPYVAVLKENEDKKGDPVYKVGNKQIVQAMAEVQEVVQLIQKEDSYEDLYEEILNKTNTIIDSYFWIHDEALLNLGQPLLQIREIANTAIDEFVKVQEQRKHAEQLVREAHENWEQLLFHIHSTIIQSLDQLVSQLSQIRALQGKCIDLKNVRYVEVSKLDALVENLDQLSKEISDKTIQFLLQEDALVTYQDRVESQKIGIENITKTIEAKAIEEVNTEISSQLELLIDILGSLKIEDVTHTTTIVEKISLIFASLNEIRAQLSRKLQTLKSRESMAEFAAQMTLLEQSVVNYLELSTSVEKADEYFTKIIVLLEELESKFSDLEDFALQIADKRDEVIQAFHMRKEQIVDQINKKSQALEQMGLRVLKNIENKAKTFERKEDIFSFFASDIMVDKVRQLIHELSDLQDVSKAENLENLLKKAQEDALRVLRDKNELYVDGKNIIALGKHKFTVNNQSLSLSLVHRNNEWHYHLTGTSFYQKVQNHQLSSYHDIWSQELASENAQVYRAEYLAYKTFLKYKQSPSIDAAAYIAQYMEQNYSEGYVKGVHNHDALMIFNALSHLDHHIDLLKYTSQLRAIAQLFWNELTPEVQDYLYKMIQAAHTVMQLFPQSTRYQSVLNQLKERFEKWNTTLDVTQISSQSIAAYLFETFTRYNKFVLSESADHLYQNFMRFINEKSLHSQLITHIQAEDFDVIDRFYLAQNGLHSYIDAHDNLHIYRNAVDEVAVRLLFASQEYQLIFGKDTAIVSPLKGNHIRIQKETLTIQYHDFIDRLSHFDTIDVPRYQDFVNLKKVLTQSYNQELKINEFQPKVLTSFVRNRLIQEVYFPLIGDNLAKQLGTAGENKRTARMGMLLLISPPGYGKTTLMEYVAQIMGLHFVKINGPTIGHAITSIDPVEAKTSGEREELKKINLAFEMADNVMLYLDDIQHLNPEFLQKFISLADGQRKIDGIFDGESKTYDLRGKRFCIVMAGNPYTESGSRFQIPDMLANRADVYNLGDVIGDTKSLFQLSLIENAAIENPYLEKVARASLQDFYKLVDYVQNESDHLPDLEGNYLKQEIDDFTAVLSHVIQVRDVVMQVNEHYIQSAAMRDDYRVEPPFKLQGSYRNMSKLVASIVPMMNKDEIVQLILTHYESEAQTLTTDAESNLLKLKQIVGVLTQEEEERWQQILRVFQKNNKHGGLAKDDKIFAQLLEFNENLEGIIQAIRNR